MQVGIIVKEFPPDTIGGAETQTKRMAAALQSRGHDVTVFTKRYRQHKGTTEYDLVRVWNLDWSPMISDITFLLSCLIAVARRRDSLDCLQCMMIYPIGFLGYLLNRLVGLPYFAWIRGNDFYIAKAARWKRWMICRVLADTLVLVQSPEIKSDVRGEFPDLDPDLSVLGNGISVPADYRSEPDEHRILYLGRLAPKKGVEYLLEGVAQLSHDAELVVVGDGDRRPHLEQRAAELDLDVQFKGFVPPDEVDEYYRRATVFVLPSVEGEGMPNAVLEAMAWGMPVITTDSGGLPSLVTDGKTGSTVPMRDPDALADAIGDLLADRTKRRELGQNARDYVTQNHSWDRIVEELTEIYAAVSR